MNFFVVLLALLLEQVYPLSRWPWLCGLAKNWVIENFRFIEEGSLARAWLAWGTCVIVPTLLCMITFKILASLSLILGFVFSLLVIYATLGFRQFSHHFSAIREALGIQQELEARSLFSEWTQQGPLPWNPNEPFIYQVMKQSTLSAHRHVFGVFAWFSFLAVLGAGPSGAVFYRLSESTQRLWPMQARIQLPLFSEKAVEVARHAWQWIDYIPVRLSAISFAVVGRFEDAINGWRQAAAYAPHDNDALLLAAASNAIDLPFQNTENASPNVDHLRSIVGLLWRALVLWMFVLGILTVARWLG